MSNLEGLIHSVRDCLDEARNKADFVAISSLLAMMKRRIFSNGIASDGTKIGNYQVDPGVHRKRRVKAGFQVSYVDLVFEGNLMESVQMAKIKDTYVIGFSLRKFKLIAQGNEEYRGKKIFTPTEEEVKKATEIRFEEFNKQFKICFNAKSKNI